MPPRINCCAKTGKAKWEKRGGASWTTRPDDWLTGCGSVGPGQSKTWTVRVDFKDSPDCAEGDTSDTRQQAFFQLPFHTCRDGVRIKVQVTAVVEDVSYGYTYTDVLLDSVQFLFVGSNNFFAPCENATKKKCNSDELEAGDHLLQVVVDTGDSFYNVDISSIITVTLCCFPEPEESDACVCVVGEDCDDNGTACNGLDDPGLEGIGGPPDFTNGGDDGDGDPDGDKDRRPCEDGCMLLGGTLHLEGYPYVDEDMCQDGCAVICDWEDGQGCGHKEEWFLYELNGDWHLTYDESTTYFEYDFGDPGVLIYHRYPTSGPGTCPLLVRSEVWQYIHKLRVVEGCPGTAFVMVGKVVFDPHDGGDITTTEIINQGTIYYATGWSIDSPTGDGCSGSGIINEAGDVSSGAGKCGQTPDDLPDYTVAGTWNCVGIEC